VLGSGAKIRISRRRRAAFAKSLRSLGGTPSRIA